MREAHRAWGVVHVGREAWHVGIAVQQEEYWFDRLKLPSGVELTILKLVVIILARTRKIIDRSCYDLLDTFHGPTLQYFAFTIT